jgi:hypothetical protein
MDESLNKGSARKKTDWESFMLINKLDIKRGVPRILRHDLDRYMTAIRYILHLYKYKFFSRLKYGV